MAGGAHGLQQVTRQAEGHHLRDVEVVALVEEAVEVDVDGVAVGGVEHDVLCVSVAQP